MESVIEWSADSADANAETNLAMIADWWANLAGTNIVWQQREIPPAGSSVDWQFQAPDERFVILSPQLKGITLYWRKPDQPPNQEDRNITVGYLKLDLQGEGGQVLTARPLSGRQYLIRITSPKIIYRQLKLDNPLPASKRTADGGAVILLRDEVQTLEVQITLSPDNLSKLLSGL